MKNVILVAQDRFDISKEERKRIINSIVEDGDCQIILLIINPGEKKEEYLSIDGVKEVITSLELEYMESMKGLSYKEIDQYRAFQTDIKTMAYRMFGDYQLSNYYFYESICFWIRFFETNKVDIIIHTKAYHGYMFDCCDVVAKRYGVKSYHMTPIGYNDTFTLYTYRQIIPVYEGRIDNIAYLLQSSYDKKKVQPSPEVKGRFRKMLYCLGGNLLEDFVTRLFDWNWKPRAYERKRAKIYWSEKFFGYLKIRSTKRYVESISCKPNFNEKYICYFLHFEPEAAIQVSTELANQLVIIKMLSETLPEGWKLYVKEHPVQFDVNHDVGYYFMFDVPLFKTKKFYKKIISIPNVKLIRNEVTSESLIDNSQAVASILGTVFFESVLKNKPVLVFSRLNPIAYLKDAFYINSFSECERAMKKIKDGFSPNYDDADEMVGKYVFKGKYMAENIMGLLNK